MIFRDKTGAPALERVPNLFRVNPSRLTKCPKRHHHVMPAGGKKWKCVKRTFKHELGILPCAILSKFIYKLKE